MSPRFAFLARTPGSPAVRIALAWAALTLLIAGLTAPAQGIGRDEGIYLAAAESYANFWGELATSPARALESRDRIFALNHEHPPLAKELFGATHALLRNALGWTSHLEGFRFGAFLFAALLSFLLALAGHDLAGKGGALLAPALFWAVPRHFYHAHPAALDMPITALWLATVLAYRESERPGNTLARSRLFAVATGLAFGAALAVKHNAWFLPPVLMAHALLARPPASGARRGPVPLAFVAMALLGPLVFVASWPWLWQDTFSRAQGYLLFHLHHENYSWNYLGHLLREPPFPIEYPFVVTALTVPAAIVFVYAGGFLHGLARLFRALRPRGTEGLAGPASAADELLLALNAFFPIGLIAWPTVPHFGGVKHWLPAMPFLALLGARALIVAGQVLSPRRSALLAGSLALLALAPGVWAVGHVHPYGTAAYNELAGGAPGAASLGMQRQFWGDDVVGLLKEINLHAVPGARVWWQETSMGAVRAWQRDGAVRGDLRWAEGPEDADLSIWQYHQEFRDKEFRTWSAFAEASRPRSPARLPRPVAGLYLDEVPLAVVYARPGAWR
jgi:4-amino-4-deoxy-L-arabinose transferase-like glycosyltransferase